MKNSETIKFLESQRIFLRPIENEDLDMYYKKALWDKESRFFTGTQVVFSRAGVQRWFDHINTDSSRIDLLICLQETNEPIGDIALNDIDHLNRSASIRIAIFNKEYWGNGYGTEAMSLLLEHGFENLNLHRVGLDVFSFNKRGIKSYEKLGFKQEGIIRDKLFYDGEYHDLIMMGVLKEEFNKRN